VCAISSLTSTFAISSPDEFLLNILLKSEPILIVFGVLKTIDITDYKFVHHICRTYYREINVYLIEVMLFPPEVDGFENIRRCYVV